MPIVSGAAPTPTPAPAQTSDGHTDSFNSGTLDGAWSWIRHDSSNESLADRSGYMRITTQGQEICSMCTVTGYHLGIWSLICLISRFCPSKLHE